MNNNHIREIGSEFWSRYQTAKEESLKNEVYLLSGRTALQFILDDIVQSKSVKKVLLPSYCCQSMIVPFVMAGIDVDFYQVRCDGVIYPYGNDANIVLMIDYFGYTVDQNREIACREKRQNKTIIYDATHKIDGNADVQFYADYSFCSYRKWFYCNYACARKHHGIFKADRALNFNEQYVTIRDSAAREKESYFAGATNDKESFLTKFRQAEEQLNDDFVGYRGIPVAFDLQRIVQKRRENATYLIRELQKHPKITLWRDNVRSCDTPMFVPIFVDPDVRDDLRRTLINEHIYCPIHWPKPAYPVGDNQLYDTELSLICDQRYDTSDMERIVRVIKNYFSR